METSKDYYDFLKEGKSDKPKKKSKTTPKRGKDDKEYLRHMDRYKRLRARYPERAEDAHADAKRLQKDGDVSEDAKLAGCYL